MANTEDNNTMETTSSGFPTSRYIHLNVGGVVYMTSQETLTRYQDSMLGNMFTQDAIPLATDNQGRFLIDRDGTVFRYILNFLRDGSQSLPHDPIEYDQLLAEARFYGLDELVERMSIHLNVNGVHYTTTRRILTRHKGSLLRELFSEEFIPLDRDGNGQHIIRRDGELFQYILYFLEHNDLHLPARFERFVELGNEAQHYKLPAVTEALNVHLMVGGIEYSSLRATLTKVEGSLLEEIFTQTPIPLERDGMGRYVIQRNGSIFKYILKYLESRQWPLEECYSPYHEIQAEVDHFKLDMITPLLICKMKVEFRGAYGFFYNSYTTSWKNLTKYTGSVLEEKFANARVHSTTQQLGLHNVGATDVEYVIKCLETGNLAEVPQSAYHNMLVIANQLRLGELQRQLNE